MNEKQLQLSFTGWLTRNNILYYKTQGGSLFTREGKPLRFKSGYSDILVFIDGEVYFIELKTETGKLRQSQAEKFSLLKKEGFTNLFILRPSHLKDMMFLKRKSKNMPWGLLFMKMTLINDDILGKYNV